MNVTLDKKKCITCGMCASVAPELFSIDSGIVDLKKDPKTFTEEDKKAAKEAAGMCPNGVIQIVE